MTDSLPEKDPKDQFTELTAQTDSFERYDLTGSKIKKWTENKRKWLGDCVDKVFAFCSNTADKTLPGNDETIKEKTVKLPGKGAEFLESKLDQIPIENQLKLAQTETEFLKQEKIREEIKKTREERKELQLSNIERQLLVAKRIDEITEGKTNYHITWENGEPTVIFGNIPGFQPTELSEVDEEKESFKKLSSFEPLSISTRTKNLLIKHDINCVADLLQISVNQLLTLRGIGAKTYYEIRDALGELGYELRDG